MLHAIVWLTAIILTSPTFAMLSDEKGKGNFIEKKRSYNLSDRWTNYTSKDFEGSINSYGVNDTSENHEDSSEIDELLPKEPIKNSKRRLPPVDTDSTEKDFIPFSGVDLKTQSSASTYSSVRKNAFPVSSISEFNKALSFTIPPAGLSSALSSGVPAATQVSINDQSLISQSTLSNQPYPRIQHSSLLTKEPSTSILPQPIQVMKESNVALVDYYPTSALISSKASSGVQNPLPKIIRPIPIRPNRQAHKVFDNASTPQIALPFLHKAPPLLPSPVRPQSLDEVFINTIKNFLQEKNLCNVFYSHAVEVGKKDRAIIVEEEKNLYEIQSRVRYSQVQPLLTQTSSSAAETQRATNQQNVEVEEQNEIELKAIKGLPVRSFTTYLEEFSTKTENDDEIFVTYQEFYQKLKEYSYSNSGRASRSSAASFFLYMKLEDLKKDIADLSPELLNILKNKKESINSIKNIAFRFFQHAHYINEQDAELCLKNLKLAFKKLEE